MRISNLTLFQNSFFLFLLTSSSFVFLFFVEFHDKRVFFPSCGFILITWRLLTYSCETLLRSILRKNILSSWIFEKGFVLFCLFRLLPSINYFLFSIVSYLFLLFSLKLKRIVSRKKISVSDWRLASLCLFTVAFVRGGTSFVRILPHEILEFVEIGTDHAKEIWHNLRYLTFSLRFRSSSTFYSDYSLGFIVSGHVKLTILELLENSWRLLSPGPILRIIRVKLQINVTFTFFKLLFLIFLRFISGNTSPLLLRFKLRIWRLIKRYYLTFFVLLLLFNFVLVSLSVIFFERRTN